MNFKKIADTSFKKLNFGKMKKIAGDIILYKCTKSHNHMSCGSWDPEWDTEFLVILGHFWPFYPPPPPLMTTWKIKILKNWKKHLEISSFYTCVPKMIWCILLEVWNFFSFLNIFCPFAPHPPPNNPQNRNFEKMKRLPEDIIILHISTPSPAMICMLPEIWSVTDRNFCHFGLFLALLPD